jgi:hypothetical protein
MAGHRTPTPDAKDPIAPPADGEHEVEVVTADGERKPASLPRRAAARIKEVFDPAADAQQLAARDIPTWPGELADDGAEPDRAAVFEQTRRAALDAAGDATLVVGNSDVPGRHGQDITPADQPPANVLATYRRQHAANTATAVDDVARKVGQLVGLDRRARHYAYDVQHLIGIHALCAKAIDQLADHDLVSHALIREVAAEVAGWQQDREVGS